MNNIQKLFAGFLVAGATLSAGLQQVAVAEASVVYDKYFIPEFNNLNFVDVAVAGTGHNNAFVSVTDEGKVFTQGYGVTGMIGNGVSLSSSTPVDITSGFNLNAGDKIIEVEGGIYYNIFALSQTGRVFSWGHNNQGQLGLPVATTIANAPTEITSSFSLNVNEKVVDFRVGQYVALFRTNDNRFFTLGYDGNGRLGRVSSPSGAVSETPALLKSDASTTFALANDETLIDFGIYFATGYITTNKNMYSWGDGSSYLHGEGNQTSKDFATRMPVFDDLLGVGDTIVSASFGRDHALAVSSNNQIWGWGVNGSNSISKYSGFAPVQNPTELTSSFYDELDHEGDGYPYSALNTSTYISQVKTYESMSFIESRWNDSGEIYGYFTWGRNGFGASTAINYHLNLLGAGYSGTSRGVPSWLGSYDYVSDTPELTFVNQGHNSAILTSEGGISFIGSNLYGQLGNGLTGSLTSTDYSGNYNTEGYYYVMSFEYDSRNLKLNWGDLLPQPFTKETIEQMDDNGTYWIIQEYLIYYYGLVEYNDGSGYNYYNNLDDQGRALLGTTLIDDVSAAFFDYDVVNYFVPYAFTLSELQNTDEQGRFWNREWAEEVVDYYVDFGYGTYEPLSAAAIAQVEAGTETILTEVRAMLANIVAFETSLKAFRSSVDIYDSNAFNLNNFKTFEDDILSLFAAYDDLTEMEQLYFEVYNEYDNNFDYLYGYYEDLKYYYFDMYISGYINEIVQISAIEDEEGYRGLISNVELIKSILSNIEDLPQGAYDYFTYYDEGNDYYGYQSYEYWIYLNNLVPFLEEAFPVNESLGTIEEGFVYVDDELELTEAQALAILNTYDDFLLLSSEAQDLLDVEYMEYLYYEAMRFFTDPVEVALSNIYDLEVEGGNGALFANLDLINETLAAYEALTQDMLDTNLGEWPKEYYAYLKGLQASLTEAKPVYDEQNEIDALIWSNDELSFTKETALRAIDNYNAYLELSEEARALLDDEYLGFIYEEAMIFLAGVVEEQLLDLYLIEDESGTEALFDNQEAIASAIADYEALSETARGYLTDEAVSYYEYLKTLLPLLTEATPVKELIEDLPSIEEVTEVDLTEILEAVESYENLSEGAQALVNSDLLYQLLEAATRKAIDNLPVLENLTLDNEAQVQAARAAYDALSEEQKALLGQDYLDRLLAAEARIVELKAGNLAQALLTFGLFVLHLGAAAYFFWIKRKALAKLTGLRVLAKI